MTWDHNPEELDSSSVTSELTCWTSVSKLL